MAENPMANESIIQKIKNRTLGNSSKEINVGGTNITAHFIGINDAVNICAEACACCWDKQIPENYQDIAEYVARRTRTGHTSVIEHSNFVIFLEIDKFYEEDIILFLDSVHYLYTKISKIDRGEKYGLLIGGSFRGYSDLYREVSLSNPVLKAITGVLYQYAHSAMFEDICKLDILNKDAFRNPDNYPPAYMLTDKGLTYENDLFKIVGIDSLKKIYANIFDISPEFCSKMSTYDLCKFGTISILFKNMSRTCTHQLVRHRNAITQESQRYVDYSKSCFSSPAMFKPEKYDANYKYKIRFGHSGQMYMTLDEIGQAMCDIYGQLYNPVIAGKEHALLREDARAFLPSNVQCRKIYITFTYKSFLKFLNLREDKAAQAEIRMYAASVGNWFRSNTEFSTKELCDNYILPRILIDGNESVKVDVDMGVEETISPVSDDDYIKAIGLDDNETNMEDNEQ